MADDAAALVAIHREGIDHAIAFVSRRNHLGHADAEDFAQETWLSLLKNDCRAIRLFEGRSAAETYFICITTNVFMNLRRRRDGQRRPSAAARRLGAPAKELETPVARDGFTPPEPTETMHAGVGVPRNALESVLTRLKTPVRWPRKFYTLSLESIGFGTDIPGPTDPEEMVIDDELMRSSADVKSRIERAWSLLSVKERLALATRFAGPARQSELNRRGLRASAVEKARRVLLELLTIAGVSWPDACRVLREGSLDLGLQEIVRQATRL